MLDTLTDTFAAAQQWLFEAAVQPIAFAVGAGNLLEDGFTATGWLLVGLMQIAVLLLVIAPLQRLWPVEPLRDRHAVGIDVLYTLIRRLGLFKLIMFFSVEGWLTSGIGWLRAHGLRTLQIDQLWPGVTDVAWVSFGIYLVVLDLLDYWIHRGQHQFNWWWSLHALHHSQRQMTMWSDNRNHLLDDVLRDTLMVLVAQIIGVAPGQFVAIIAFTQLSESFQHANLRLWFGRLGERLWVSPRFHRLHHSVGIGHESPLRSNEVKSSQGKTRLGGANFGVLLPWWDMLFGTANFELRFDPTGVRDQVEQGRDYGRGFWSPQWLGLTRRVGRA